MSEAIDRTGPFGELDRIVLDGATPFRFLREVKDFYHFYEVGNSERVRAIAKDALEVLVDQPKKFRHDIDYYSFVNMEKRAKGAPAMADLEPVAASDLHHKYELVMAWRAALAQTPLNEPNREQAALDRVYLEVAMRYLRRDVRSALARKEKPITLETLLVWNKRLKSFGDDPGALIDGRTVGSGNRTPRFTPEEEDLITWALVMVYLQTKKPSARKTWALMEIEGKKRNRERAAEGKPPVSWPSLTAFKHRVGAIPAFLKHVCRYGAKSAEREYHASYGGQGHFRPGQRMEVDGWVCHLHALVENTKMWADLPEEIRKRLKKVRVVFIVVIDVATRSVLGIQFSWSESAAAITAALRMAVENKTLRAKRYGCNSPWPQYGWGVWVHDQAVVYSQTELVQKVLKAVNADQHSVVGAPWLRGTIESFFKTIATDLLIHFTGQTGSNLVSRTEYQTQDHASVTVDELIAKVIEWIVEKYHHTNHPDLGITPLAAWHRLSQIAPPPPRHGPAKLIEIFGTRLPRKVGGTGVTLAGSQFQSHSLQVLRKLLPTSKTTVWVDPENLGHVLVHVPPKYQEKIQDHVDGWLLVQGPKVLSGISLRHIEIVDDELALRFGYDKFTSATRVGDFVEGLRSFALDAERLRLTEKPLTAEAIERLINRNYHFALGDEDFCKEREALLAPIDLAKGEPPPVAEDNDAITISI